MEAWTEDVCGHILGFDRAKVGASRFKTADGLYHYGRIRRSDWLPVGEDVEGEQLDRGVESSMPDEDSEAEAEEEAREAAGDFAMNLEETLARIQRETAAEREREEERLAYIEFLVNRGEVPLTPAEMFELGMTEEEVFGEETAEESEWTRLQRLLHRDRPSDPDGRFDGLHQMFSQLM